MYGPALAVVLVALTQTPTSQRDATAIDAARAIIVYDLDASMPQVTFDAWLRDLVGPQAAITWAVNDCGEQTGNPALDKDRDFPMCVEATVVLAADRRLFVSLMVGTFKRGVGPGAPQFRSAATMTTGQGPRFISSIAKVAAAVRDRSAGRPSVVIRAPRL